MDSSIHSCISHGLENESRLASRTSFREVVLYSYVSIYGQKAGTPFTNMDQL